MRPAHALPFVFLCLLAWPAAGPAHAGAWLRAAGEGFASSSVKIQDAEATKSYGTVYLEYGLTPDLTGGLDIGSDEAGDYKALAFVLMPVSRADLHVAFQLAAGAVAGAPAFRPGLSLGRGLRIGGLDGWASLDTRATITPGDVDLAMDATLGLDVWDGTKMIWQLQQGGALHEPDFLRATASVVWQATPGMDIEVGVTSGLLNVEDFGLKLGLWRTF